MAGCRPGNSVGARDTARCCSRRRGVCKSSSSCAPGGSCCSALSVGAERPSCETDSRAAAEEESTEAPAPMRSTPIGARKLLPLFAVSYTVPVCTSSGSLSGARRKYIFPRAPPELALSIWCLAWPRSEVGSVTDRTHVNMFRARTDGQACSGFVPLAVAQRVHSMLEATELLSREPTPVPPQRPSSGRTVQVRRSRPASAIRPATAATLRPSNLKAGAVPGLETVSFSSHTQSGAATRSPRYPTATTRPAAPPQPTTVRRDATGLLVRAALTR